MPWTTGAWNPSTTLKSLPIMFQIVQFAYNEASFFLVRLLQQFSSFTLATESQPPESLPSHTWAGRPGPPGRDRIRLAAHLTMYVKGGLWVRMGEAGEVDV
jgi:hypothetical protein